MIDDETRMAVIAAARRVGTESGVSPVALLAVAIAETGAVPFAEVEGRREPLIRFEGHVFDRLLGPAARAAARAAGLAGPKAGAVANPPGQADRWRLLRRAAALDAQAAHAATSWGLGQVMGFHARALGFADAGALASEARGSVEGQLRLVAAFLKRGDLHGRLDEGAFAAFARLYNGPAYRRNRYDETIERAVAQARRWLAAGASAAAVPVAADGP